MARDFEDLKNGTVLEPYHLNVIYRELRRWRKMRGATPLTVQGADSGDAPPVVRLLRGMRPQLAVANGAITARSGTTAGSGQVYLVDVDGTTLSTGSVAYDVINPSSSTMTSGNSIDDGQYCWVAEEPTSGKLVVWPLECS